MLLFAKICWILIQITNKFWNCLKGVYLYWISHSCRSSYAGLIPRNLNVRFCHLCINGLPVLKIPRLKLNRLWNFAAKFSKRNFKKKIRNPRTWYWVLLGPGRLKLQYLKRNGRICCWYYVWSKVPRSKVYCLKQGRIA